MERVEEDGEATGRWRGNREVERVEGGGEGRGGWRG